MTAEHLADDETTAIDEYALTHFGITTPPPADPPADDDALIDAYVATNFPRPQNP